MDSQISCGKSNPQDDEWTTVPRGKRRAARTTPAAPGTDRDITLDKLTADYQHWMRKWRASTCRRQVRRILDQKQPDDGWQIKQAICFASGSFCRDNWECRKRSMIQFVAFMDTVDRLISTSEDEIRILAQEPVYTPLDVEFLSSLNISASTETMTGGVMPRKTALEDECTHASFVFEAFMDKTLPAVRQLLELNARLMIGTPSPTTGASSTSAEDLKEMRALYKKFDVDHSSYYFPTFGEDPNVFDGLRIRWREPREDD